MKPTQTPRCLVVIAVTANDNWRRAADRRTPSPTSVAIIGRRRFLASAAPGKWSAGYGDERERNLRGFAAINADAFRRRAATLPSYR